MRLLVTHPELALGLVVALNETDCHAATEVLFFVRAWASGYAGFRATLLRAS
jgi:hypothetical protein